jgi:ABC-type transport system substrate-binding protein
MYDRLAMPDAEGVYQPQAAESWEHNGDYRTWTVKIHDNIYDEAGNHITASDVVWFINEYMSNGIKPCFGQVESCSVIDDYSLEIVMKSAMANMFEVVLESTFIVSQKAYEESEDGFASKPITSGPYNVTEFTPSTSITFTKNEDYWMGDFPEGGIFASNVDVINVINITEASQLQIALETGTIDVAPSLNLALVDNFASDTDNYTTVFHPSNNDVFLMFSGDSHSILADNLELRQAICYAIDVDPIIDAVAYGYAEVSHDIVPRVTDGHLDKWEDEPYYECDTEKAKELLAESGYNGEEITFICSASNTTMPTIVQAQCQAVGINIKLDPMDGALYSTSWYDGTRYDIAFIASGNGGANIWNQFIDGTSYEKGDAMARKDDTLTELVQWTSLIENYTDENIDEVHKYVMENAYCYSLYLPLVATVFRNDIPLATSVYNNEGPVDVASCSYYVD